MKFFTDIMHDLDAYYLEPRSRFELYAEHLEQIKSKLPERVYEFAAAPWHYDHGEKGPHDSWLESLTIFEPSGGERNSERSIEIEAKLLSGYHDRILTLHYFGVRKYKIQSPARYKHLPSYKTGHGDWLYDEFHISRSGRVIHEVRFSRGSTWWIECDDMEFKSEPIPGSEARFHGFDRKKHTDQSRDV